MTTYPGVALLFHSVGLERHDWAFPWISEPVDLFAKKMRALARRRYDTVFFRDHDPGRRYDRKTVILTFDDGYLDNWVHVAPILAEHGLRATVFVTLDFVDPRPIVRERGESAVGFMSWDELRAAERSGVFDIQSHAVSHTWFPSGPRVTGFWSPGSATRAGGPIWMLWNEAPEEKPFYLTGAADLESRVPYGTPVFEHRKSLEAPRFLPEERLAHALPEFVERHGGRGFFEAPDWEARLRAEVERVQGGHEGNGRYEDEASYHRRIRRELEESKLRLESELDKTIDVLCWPGGGVNEDVVRIAREVGYRKFTLPTAWRGRRQTPGYEGFVPRTAGSLERAYRGRDLGSVSVTELMWTIERELGSGKHLLLTRAALAMRLVGSCFGIRGA